MKQPEWIEWDVKFDGDCPVPDGHDVEVRFLDGETERNDMPEEWNWYNTPKHVTDLDIVAYRDWTAFTNEQGESAAHKSDADVKALRDALSGLLNALPSATTHPAIIAAREALDKTKPTGEIRCI